MGKMGTKAGSRYTAGTRGCFATLASTRVVSASSKERTKTTLAAFSVIMLSERLIAVPSEFLKVFPMLEDVLIESWQEGIGMGNPYTSTLPSRAYGRPHSATNRVIACANRNCKNGGFDILQDISKMVHERLTMREFVQVCCGAEGPAKGLGRDCINTLHYRLTLEYTPGQSPE